MQIEIEKKASSNKHRKKRRQGRLDEKSQNKERYMYK